MANFYVSLTQNEMATNIATLLNQHNRLYKRHNGLTISNSPVDYFVELGVADGATRSTVVGCLGLQQLSPQLSLIKHISVAETHRRRGIADKLLNLALSNCKTPEVCMTIRMDNIPSLMMAGKAGFAPTKLEWSRDHYVVTVWRRL